MQVNRLRQKLISVQRQFRETRIIAQALKSSRHPVEAQIVPIRRCNLSCSYCNEFDSYSEPVPAEEMLERIDRLAALGTLIITISGGEPLLHPSLDLIIQRIRSHGILAGLITNGYLLTAKRIKRLNSAGLDHIQISIDNVPPPPPPPPPLVRQEARSQIPGRMTQQICLLPCRLCEHLAVSLTADCRL